MEHPVAKRPKLAAVADPADLADLTQSRYRSERGSAYLSGIQALARLPLDQRRLDARAGLRTAGFISGYRGSPLGGLDRELSRCKRDLQAQQVVFQPGVNEDLAATAVWGSQQVGLFPGARHDGVFGMWYGKAPGLDRSSDALRHANAAGSSALGGVLLVVGDDHGCKSSTLPSASEFALRDLGMPVLAPADVQDVLDFGLFGWALSRRAGCWAGLVVVADVADSAMTIDVDSARRFLQRIERASGRATSADVHIRRIDSPLQQEARLQLKLRLAADFALDAGIDRVVVRCPGPRLVVVTAGKVYADVREAFAKLGLGSERQLAAAGVRLAKLGMAWPLNARFMGEVCADAGRVLVIEEKRPFIEEQLRSLLFGQPTEVRGKLHRSGACPAPLPVAGELDVATIARALAEALGSVPNESYLHELQARADALAGTQSAKDARKPLYCAGCPHNTSTRVPAGSRAGAGIGCHYMAQWMDRNTYAVTHMGAEGVNWLGQAPFTDERHIFVNLGDGTYFHSGILAIRAAVAAGANVTYKVLFNDAVAMTGGQSVDGDLTVAKVVEQVRAEGVGQVVVVCAEPKRHRGAPYPVRRREDLDAVQRQLRDAPGVSVLIYDQTCAAQLRRRRKRGQAADPDVRVAINDALCEGCGDCSKQSNCVAVEPLPTEFGVKRAINQSACNKDLSCLAGLCPALVTLSGARPKRRHDDGVAESLAQRLPAPAVKESANILIAGVGGTGIVTLAQLIGTAAHLDGKFASTLDMTGLAQKGGAVLSHVRVSPVESPHPPTRISPGDAQLVIAADLLTATGIEALTATSGRTVAVANSCLAPTAEFALGKRHDWSVEAMRGALAKRVGELAAVEADALATRLFGSSAAANTLLLGHACQLGALPVSPQALRRAIALNGVAVADNLAAFDYGRATAHDGRLLPKAARGGASNAMQPPKSQTLEELIDSRSRYLKGYQNEALAERYERLVRRVRSAEHQVAPSSSALAHAVADSYFRLLAVKDEYEVARLFSATASAAGGNELDFAARLGREFEPGFKITFHFAPPLLNGLLRGATGRPRKIAVGSWALLPLRWLAKARWLRGRALDPFRHTEDARLARTLLACFEGDFEAMAAGLRRTDLASAIELAKLPCTVKGFGAVKAKFAQSALARRRVLLDELASGQRAFGAASATATTATAASASPPRADRRAA